MSRPFEDLHVDLNSLQSHPDPHLLKRALLSGGRSERLGLASLWLSEGIPYAFISFPAVYQQLRSEISKRLNVGVKDVSVVGSSRMGYSLASYKFGRKFDGASDLDLCIVNCSLFDSIKNDVERFIEDIRSGRTTADRPNIQKLWSDSCEQLPTNIARGFIDVKKIPAIAGKYDRVCDIKNDVYFVSKRLKDTEYIPRFKDVSIRVYRDWGSMVDQVSLSLYGLKRYLESENDV
ncbi:hypothetical protein [Pseudomonas gingeri]|uniref:hypothetical protein n=1 Tax=Pseudomonas gingeri TaxID=117681 RepID=UPI0015A0F0A5|nr:hypothetical protein [Pseudomonas gingeri]NWE50450.1 hypothetical protein [Pseudomonas gingeri]